MGDTHKETDILPDNSQDRDNNNKQVFFEERDLDNTSPYR